nr:MAG TPA: hypothetical protein [Caudoviricetes sp.]
MIYQVYINTRADQLPPYTHLQKSPVCLFKNPICQI